MRIQNFVSFILVVCLLISIGLADRERKISEKKIAAMLAQAKLIEEQVDDMQFEYTQCKDNLTICLVNLERCDAELEVEEISERDG